MSGNGEQIKIDEKWLQTLETEQKEQLTEEQQQQLNATSAQMDANYHSKVRTDYGYFRLNHQSAAKKEQMRLGSIGTSFSIISKHENTAQTVTTESQLDTLRNDFFENKKLLLENTRWRSDSREMTQVKDNLRSLTSGLETTVPSDTQEFHRQLTQRVQEYSRLSLACYTYMSGWKRKTSERYRLVSFMSRYANAERQFLLARTESALNITQGTNWFDYIKNARAIELTQAKPLPDTQAVKNIDDTERYAIASRRFSELMGCPALYQKHHLAIDNRNGEDKFVDLFEKTTGRTLQDVRSDAETGKKKLVVNTSAADQFANMKLFDQLMGISDRPEETILVNQTVTGDTIIITGITLLPCESAFKNLTVKDETLSLKDRNLDSSIVNKLLNLNTDMIDYLFGDLLSSREREIVKDRLDQFQKLARNGMVGSFSKKELKKRRVTGEAKCPIVPVYRYLTGEEFNNPALLTQSPRYNTVFEKKSSETTSYEYASGAVNAEEFQYSSNWAMKKAKRTADENVASYAMLIKELSITDSITSAMHKRIFGEYFKAHKDELMQDGKLLPIDIIQEKFDQYCRDSHLADPKGFDTGEYSTEMLAREKKEPLFTHEPSPLDVKQGFLGDCYFLAAIARLASTNPNFIVNMMRDMGDGYVRVRLYEKGKPMIVTVKKSIPIMKSNSTGNAIDLFARGALWVQMLEAALAASGIKARFDLERYDSSSTLKDQKNAEYLRDGKKNAKARKLNRRYNSSFQAISGGQAYWAYGVLTGMQNGYAVNISKDGLDEIAATEGLLNNCMSDIFSPEVLTAISHGLQSELKKKICIKTGSETNPLAALRTVTVNMVDELLGSIRDWEITPDFPGVEALFLQYKKASGNSAVTLDTMLAQLQARIPRLYDHCLKNDVLQLETNTQYNGQYAYAPAACTFFEHVQEMLHYKSFVTFGTRIRKPKTLERNEGGGLEQKADGMFEGHEYTVLNAFQGADGKFYFTLRNPHANHGMKRISYVDESGNPLNLGNVTGFDTENSGLFDLELNEAMRFINVYSYGKEIPN